MAIRSEYTRKLQTGPQWADIRTLLVRRQPSETIVSRLFIFILFYFIYLFIYYFFF